MNSQNSSLPSAPADKILVRGIHLTLTPTLKDVAVKRGDHLLRHHDRIVRLRFDLERDHAKSGQDEFIAHGRLEISGPDLVASVASDEILKSLNLLVDKLDRMLRERSRLRADRRNNRPENAEFRDRLADSQTEGV